MWEVLQGPHSSVCKGLEGAWDMENFLGLGKVGSGNLHKPSLAESTSMELGAEKSYNDNKFLQDFSSLVYTPPAPFISIMEPLLQILLLKHTLAR